MKKWIGVLALVFASKAHAEIEVRQVLFQGHLAADPRVRFIAASSEWDGFSAQLWRGDYLWSQCKETQGGTNQRIFQCGSQKVIWDTARRSLSMSSSERG